MWFSCVLSPMRCLILPRSEILDTKNLPDRDREYQQIDYRPYLNNSIPEMPFYMDFDSVHFFRYSLEGDMGTIRLEMLNMNN